MASLVNANGQKLPLNARRRTTIGRSSDNDIVLQHRSVSRRHALVQCSNQQFSVKDLNSRNGTWVGNRKVGELRLFDGDTVRFGEVELVFENSAQRAEDYSRTESPGRARRFAGLLGKPVAAAAVMILLGLGLARLILRHSLDTANQASRLRRVSAEAPSSSDSINPIAVGRAIILTDRKHADDSSWIAVEPTAQMCNRGVLEANSTFCRVAYLARHAEGKDLNRGPQSVGAADLAEFCDRGAIDSKSPVCAESSSVRP